MFIEAAYLPSDRLRALINQTELPQNAQGSALFADISGFTSVTEQLREIYGFRRGPEELAIHLNRVYDALVEQVDLYNGSIIGFAGDAITCWFNEDISALRATTCGFALLTAMRKVEQVALPEGKSSHLGLKVVVTSGTTKRFVVGDPKIQLIDTLAGKTVSLVALGESLAQRGELLAHEGSVQRLGHAAHVGEWREIDSERFAVLDAIETEGQTSAITVPDSAFLLQDALQVWILPALRKHLQDDSGEFQIELRPVTALFIRFTNIDYDQDAEAEKKLDRLLRLIQDIVSSYEGNVLQLTIGDKGSYVYAAFGAPYTHEDDPIRALNAAIDIQNQVKQLDFLDPIQIGVSRGLMRTGAYGGRTRRTYGILGDDVNLAARLMTKAEPGTTLVSETILGINLDRFVLNALTSIQVKGKSRAIPVFQLIGRQDHSFEKRFYTTPLVGRDNVLKDIQAALHPVFLGHHAGLIYLNGEAGIGKSRLAFEAQQQLQAVSKATWFVGQADQLNGTPFSAFSYFLRPYFGQRREQDTNANLEAFNKSFDQLLSLVDDANRADLMLYQSFLAYTVGLLISDSAWETVDEKLRTDNAIAGIKAWVRAECIRQPVVIQIEDAQWLDASSARTVQQLTYNLENTPLALILTSRYKDDGTRFTIPDIYSVLLHTFDLNRLTDESVQAVTEAILNGKPNDELARFMRERAEGNPFFTEQLILDLKERGGLVETDKVWHVQNEALTEIPSRINQVLIARLDRLAAQVRTVVQTASVLGREFDVTVLSRMLREGEISGVKEAEREAIWSALDELRYIFRHALLRDAAYNMQAQLHLRTLHRLAAESIEALYPENATHYDTLLEHWRNAQVADKTLRYAIPVCERLINITAEYPQAERILKECLTLDNTPTRATFLRLLGDLEELRSDYPTASTYYEACLNVSQADVIQHIRALDGLAKISLPLYDQNKSAYWSEKALALARQHPDQLGIARSLTNLGVIAFQLGNYATARIQYEEGLRIFKTLNLQSDVVGSLNRLANIATKKGEYTEARYLLEECLMVSREIGDRQRVGTSLNALGNISLQEGNYAAARNYYLESLRIKRETGARLGIGSSLGNLAIVAMEQGNLIESANYAEASLRERRAIGDTRGIAHALGLLGSITGYRMNYTDAQGYFKEALEITRELNDRTNQVTALHNLGEL
ncbi:MAG: tetratricopeptide repeat protein, partial [Chloroflexota bacterium]